MKYQHHLCKHTQQQQQQKQQQQKQQQEKKLSSGLQTRKKYQKYKYRDFLVNQKYKEFQSITCDLEFVVYNNVSHDYFVIDFKLLDHESLNTYIKNFLGKNIIKKSKQGIRECLISFIHKSSWKEKSRDVQVAFLILLLNQSSFFEYHLNRINDVSRVNDFLWNLDNFLVNPQSVSKPVINDTKDDKGYSVIMFIRK